MVAMSTPEYNELYCGGGAFPPIRVLSLQEARKEVLRPCSRFRSPVPWDERTDHEIAALAHRFDPFAESALTVAGGVPLNWQVLVKYLHSKGLTDSTQFQLSETRNDLPRMFKARLAPRSDTSGSDGREVKRYGFASTLSAEESMSRAVGELLERYVLSIYRERDLLQAAPSDLSGGLLNALDIFSLNEYLPWQKARHERFVRAEDAPLRWVRGKELLSGKNALIPAQLVYWNYRYMEGETILAETNTNGGAGHFTRTEAIVAALLELIQRDGFLIYWLNHLSPPRIDPTTIADPEVKELLQRIIRYRLEYYFLNVTTDLGVPACVCVIVDRHHQNGPHVSMGGAAGFSLKELLLQSAGEALAVHMGTIEKDDFKLPDDYIPFAYGGIGREERLVLWRGNEMLKHFDFFLRGPLQSAEGFIGDAQWKDTPEKRLSYLLERLRSMGKGYEVFVHESKHEVLEALGFTVVKVVVPRVMNLYLNERSATLAAPRLRETPAKLGNAPAESFTPWPHPFP